MWWKRPLTDNALSKLNDALITAGFSAIDIEHALKSDILVEDAFRQDGEQLVSHIYLRPDSAGTAFKFGKVTKLGKLFFYPAFAASDDDITDFIEKLIGATASN